MCGAPPGRCFFINTTYLSVTRINCFDNVNFIMNYNMNRKWNKFCLKLVSDTDIWSCVRLLFARWRRAVQWACRGSLVIMSTIWRGGLGNVNTGTSVIYTTKTNRLFLRGTLILLDTLGLETAIDYCSNWSL